MGRPSVEEPGAPPCAGSDGEGARLAIARAVAGFCEGSEGGLDLGSRFGPGTSPLAVVEAVARALEDLRSGRA